MNFDAGFCVFKIITFIMKLILFPFILVCSLFFSCSKKEASFENNYSIENKLKFINLILKFYVEDSIICNNLYNRLEWKSFKSAMYSEEGLLLKIYAPNMKIEDIESQMGSFVLTEKHNDFFPNYKLTKEDTESLSDSIHNPQSNLYYTTMPVFTNDGNFAFVGFSMVSSFLSGHGEIIVFERKDNRWKEVERKHIWMH